LLVLLPEHWCKTIRNIDIPSSKQCYLSPLGVFTPYIILKYPSGPSIKQGSYSLVKLFSHFNNRQVNIKVPLRLHSLHKMVTEYRIARYSGLKWNNSIDLNVWHTEQKLNLTMKTFLNCSWFLFLVKYYQKYHHQ
jgi:hypothetical protein